MEIFIQSIPLWIELVSLAFCTGILIFFLWVLSAAKTPEAGLHNRLWLLFIISAATAMAGSVFDLLLRVAEMSGETLLSSFPFVPAVLFKTHSGRVWLIRMACLVLMLAAGSIKKVRAARPVLVILFCLDIIIAFTESASGHAADKGDFSTPEIVDWIHFLGALAWAGGIFVLSFVVLPRGLDLNTPAFRSLARQVARFSNIAGIAVVSVVLTAFYNAVVYVGSLGALLRTSYGLTIATKIALLFLLLLLAAYNRYISAPNLGRLAGLADAAKDGFFPRPVRLLYSRLSLSKTGADSLLYFKRAVRLEAILLLGLLFCAALLRHEIPARHAMHGDHTGAPLHEHMRH